MLYPNYINHEFSEYLNRYMTGIILLKTKLEKVEVLYQLSDAFSNHACRFKIDVEFRDINSLSEEEKAMANKFFYNSSSDTGIGFVSFSYQPRGSYDIDFEEIRSFIRHYEFAAAVFSGTIKYFLPPECVFTISSLEEEPLFLYAQSFLRHLDYSEESRKQKREYEKFIGRSFDFDCAYHTRLIETAAKV